MRTSWEKGFTLLELMIVIMIIAVLAAVAIPAFGKYIKKSRATEAYGNLRKIYDGEMAYFSEDHTLEGGKLASKAFVWNPTTPNWPPGKDKRPGDWNAFNWSLINFASDSPVYYVYSVWVVPEVGPPAPFTPPISAPNTVVAAFAARAQGDLDGDGEFSFLERIASFEEGVLRGFPSVWALDELE